MHQPPGFVDSEHPDYVCHLRKSLCGLKQAPRAWFQRFDTYALRLGFQHSKTNSSLFIFWLGSDTAYLLLYVNDIILTSSSLLFLRHIISALSREFAMTDQGPLSYFLGIYATRSLTGLFLSQQKYEIDILEGANLLNYNLCKTPVDTDSKLEASGPPVHSFCSRQSGSWAHTGLACSLSLPVCWYLHKGTSISTVLWFCATACAFGNLNPLNLRRHISSYVLLA